MVQKNGHDIPQEILSEIEEIIRVTSEIERYRHHPQFHQLAKARQGLLSLMGNIAGLYGAEGFLHEHLNKAGGLLLADGPIEKATLLSDVAEEARKSLYENPDVIAALDSTLSTYRVAVEKLIEMFDISPSSG